MFCQKCGMENKDGASFCNSCGADLRLIPIPATPASEPVPEPIPCKSCGTIIPYGEIYCPKCFVRSPWPDLEQIKKPVAKTKHNEVIQAKIATKEEQIKGISQTGPILTVIFGILVCLTLVGIIFGLIIIGFAVWWSSSRENEKKKLQGEIAELKTEME